MKKLFILIFLLKFIINYFFVNILLIIFIYKLINGNIYSAFKKLARFSQNIFI